MTTVRNNPMWSGDLIVPEPPAAARVGSDLRAARERLGWTLPAIAAHLRIRLPFLEAIEQGRTQDLPGSAYAVGFVRTYAQALGLDAAEVARRFRLEAGEVNRKTELDFPAPVPERGVPALAVALVGIVLIVGGYAAWYRMSGNARPPADAVQALPARLAPLAVDKPAAVAVTKPAPAPPPPAAPGAMPAAPSASPPPQMAAVAPPPPPPPAISPSSAAAATTQPPAPLPTADMSAADAPPQLALRATADAWLQVRDRSGKVLLNRVLRAGETWPVPDGGPALLLTTGNAGGTELVVNGIASAPLGGDGAVRRDLPLDPAVLKDGKLAASAGSGTRRTTLPHNQ